MKTDVIRTVVVTIILLTAALLIHAAPGLLLLIAPFMLLPGLYLYMKNKQGFYIMAAIVVATSLVLSLFTLQIMLAVLLASYTIGQLLSARASREFMLFILTTLLSMYTLISIIFLQLKGTLGTTTKWFSELKDSYSTLVEAELGKENISQENMQLFNMALDQMQLQLPGIIIFLLFLLSLLMLTITMPLLRKFKIATPDFRPLYAWRVPRSTFYLYILASIIKLMLTPNDIVMLGIVTNFQYVLEWIIFIQGLSLISFFTKMKRIPVAANVLIFIMAFIMSPVTQLLGMLDLIMNLKARIKL